MEKRIENRFKSGKAKYIGHVRESKLPVLFDLSSYDNEFQKIISLTPAFESLQVVRSNKTVSIFILKTIYFILQNMFRSLHTSSSVVQIKSTVNIQIIRVCYNVTVLLK